MKKFIMLVLSVLLLVSLAACSNSDDTTSLSKDESRTSSAITDNNNKTEINSDKSVLIAYFSWSGNTKQLADMIQKEVGGDMFEIKPETPYTDNINELSGIALQEQRENARPELRNHIDDMSKYDIIFIGYPNWWSDMPMPVFTFLEEYDFSGKTIIPFSTYGESGFGKSIDSIKSTVTDSTVLDGLAVQENELDNAKSKVTEWLKDINILK